MAWKQILVKADPQPPLGLLIDFKRKGRNPYKVYRLLADLERQPFRMADNTTEDLTFDDFELINYDHHPVLKFPVAV